MRLLAFDLATRTGWALWDGFRLESGVDVFDVKRGESPGLRYLKFNRWLDLIVPDGLDLIVYEQPFVMRSGAAAEIALGLATRVQELCARRGIEHAAVNGTTLKKWLTGKGNAKKPAVVAAVCSRWKVVTDDNEADAIALLYYTMHDVIGPVRA